jgi:hypothetical protein
MTEDDMSAALVLALSPLVSGGPYMAFYSVYVGITNP